MSGNSITDPSIQCTKQQLTNLSSPSSLTTLQTITPTRPTPTHPHRTFTTTPTLLKKGAKAAREEKRASQPSSLSGSSNEDPSDFSSLEAEISTAIERLKDDLSKLRAGGRFNPEVLEALRVQVDKSSAQKVRLGDLAQVVPRGRQVQVIVGEKEVSFSCFLCHSMNVEWKQREEWEGRQG